MHAFKTAVLATSLVALTGCSTSDNRAIFLWRRGSQILALWSREYGQGVLRHAGPRGSRKRASTAGGRAAAAQKQTGTLSSRVSDLEPLRSQFDQSKGSLAKAEKDLLKALQPEIAKGTVSVHQSGDALTINLDSSLLFDSGQDQLKSGGTDALKRVGGVLKDFPEKQVHVAGYTDNIAIKGALQKKFPSNKELSDARANSAAQALRDGGVSSNLSAAGHGDSNPIASNNTVAGRAKNRRVEIGVTK